MTRRFFACAILALALSGSLLAQSQPPSDGPQQRQPDRPKDNADQNRETAKATFPKATVDISGSTAETTKDGSGIDQDEAEHLRSVFLEKAVDPVTWFTLLLFLVAWRQFVVMRRQADLMKEGLTIAAQDSETARLTSSTTQENLEIVKLQLRPYLRCSGCRLYKPKYGMLAADLEFRNDGNTPAGIVSIDRRYSFALVTPERGGGTSADEGFTVAEVFPNPDRYVTTIEIANDDVPSHTFALQIYGRITYINRLSKTREYCDFGYQIQRLSDGEIVYHSAPGLFDAMKWIIDDQRTRRTAGNSPIFLGGDPNLSVSSKQE